MASGGGGRVEIDMWVLSSTPTSPSCRKAMASKLSGVKRAGGENDRKLDDGYNVNAYFEARTCIMAKPSSLCVAALVPVRICAWPYVAVRVVARPSVAVREWLRVASPSSSPLAFAGKQ